MHGQRSRLIVFIVIIASLALGVACCFMATMVLLPIAREKISEWRGDIRITTPTYDWEIFATSTRVNNTLTKVPEPAATATATRHKNVFPFISRIDVTVTPTLTNTLIPTKIQPNLPATATTARRLPSPTATHKPNPATLAVPTLQLSNYDLTAQILEERPTDLFQIKMRYPAIDHSQVHPGDGFDRLIRGIVEDERVKGTQLAWDTLDDEMQGYWWMDYRVLSNQELASGSANLFYFTHGDFIATPQPNLKLNEAVLRQAHDVLGVLLEVQSYAGSSHPGVRHIAVNYDLTEDHPIELGDLFESGKDYLAILSAACTEALMARGGEIDLNGASPKAEHYQVWNVTQRGLLITFEEYQLGSAAMNPVQILVPYTRLVGVLNWYGALGNLNNK